MKKAILSLAFAAVMAFGASAQTASVPNWYTYQGICSEKSATVTVGFYIVQGDEETPVFAEQHFNVATNAAGAFSVQLGLGTPWTVDMYETVNTIDEIDWTADTYKLVTYINGTIEGSAELGSVPYATVAGRALSIDGFDGDIAQTLEDMQQRDDTLYELIQDINTNGITPLSNLIADLTEEVEANADAIENATSDIVGIQETLRGKANVTDVTELQDQMEIVSGDLQGVVESLRGKANVDDVEALWEGLETTQEDVLNLTEGNKENKAAIAALQAAVAALTPGEVDLTGIQDQIDALADAVDNATSDIVGIQETLRGKANVNDVTELQDQMEIVSGDLQGVVESLRGKANVADVEALAEGLETTQEDVLNLTEGNKENKAAIAELQGNVEELLQMIDQNMADVTTMINSLDNHINDVEAEVAINTNGLAIAEQNIIELTEQVKSNTSATTDAVNKVQLCLDEIVNLKRLIQTQGEAIADLQLQILAN